MFGFKKFLIRCRAVILDQGELLIVKHPQNLSSGVLPGGHLEWGEDIKEGLRREIVEELGINPKIGRLLYVNNFINRRKKQSIEFFFEVINSSEYRNIENTIRTHANEIAEICWIKPTDTVTILPKILAEDFKIGNILSDEVRYINVYKIDKN